MQAERKPVVCLHNNKGQEHPGMCEQEMAGRSRTPCSMLIVLRQDTLFSSWSFNIRDQLQGVHQRGARWSQLEHVLFFLCAFLRFYIQFIFIALMY